MTDSLSALIHDTLRMVKNPLFSKKFFLSTEKEVQFFISEIPAVCEEKVKPVIEKARTATQVPQTKEVKKNPALEIQYSLQKIAPNLKLTDKVLDDREAKKVSTSWKERITDADVVLLACQNDTKTVEFLKSLAKAIDKNLAKSKIVLAQRLEQEKRWDLFLQNPLRLIIASEGLQHCKELLRFYREFPAKGQLFLSAIPLLALSPSIVYSQLENKALLWKTLCQMLKK